MDNIHPMQLMAHSIDSIQDTIRSELTGKFNAMMQFPEIRLCSDSLIDGCREMLQDELNSIDSYTELDEFIGKYYRMSLAEWIKSL